MVRFIGNIFRPPSEADSFLIQTTIGCTHNKCAFCGMYADKPKFSVRDIDDVIEDIKTGSELYPGASRAFLCDGNAMALPFEHISDILDCLNEHLPNLRRVGAYASARDINSKTEQELRELREKKLSIAYLGLESGDDEVLKKMNKGASTEEMIKAVNHAQNSGIKMSVMALLGLGGRKNWKSHAEKTAQAVNKMNPRFISFLSVMIVPGTPLERMIISNEFELPEPEEILRELRVIIGNLELDGSILRSNHASNYLPLAGTMPKDKQRLLEEIDDCIEGVTAVKLEFLRGL